MENVFTNKKCLQKILFSFAGLRVNEQCRNIRNEFCSSFALTLYDCRKLTCSVDSIEEISRVNMNLQSRQQRGKLLFLSLHIMTTLVQLTRKTFTPYDDDDGCIDFVI